ncbi:hypothetical protein [Umezawaea sp. Da 62-37]|uniref:hypothetical protein n=1 Tax=Umezawaea sp. Da 62-37 TaxID=3075927 RepID=UPI0028F6DFEF|nr:hypothetical protein [Umezawaea sp. Da 62-37]WNV84908.1 hypothetical protein RM788_43235 [Umezawaea sp. Da 62-37]
MDGPVTILAKPEGPALSAEAVTETPDHLVVAILASPEGLALFLAQIDARGGGHVANLASPEGLMLPGPPRVDEPVPVAILASLGGLTLQPTCHVCMIWWALRSSPVPKG